MAYLLGTLLALVVAVTARVTRFDRDRSFYPTLLIVIASYYLLFAVMGSPSALIAELLFALFFAALAFTGAYISVWFIGAGLALHGVFDLFHAALLTNEGVPLWWPAFCFAVDVTLALWLAWLVSREPITPVEQR